jgi:hypothetical protein
MFKRIYIYQQIVIVKRNVNIQKAVHILFVQNNIDSNNNTKLFVFIKISIMLFIRRLTYHCNSDYTNKIQPDV